MPLRLRIAIGFKLVTKDFCPIDKALLYTTKHILEWKKKKRWFGCCE